VNGAPRVREIVPAERVRARIGELAAEIATTLRAEQPPLFVVIAEGARRFADALLAAAVPHGLAAETLVVRARRTDGQELKGVAIDDFDALRCAGRAVVIVDDIADEGRTLEAVRARVAESLPASVRTAVLVSKKARRRVAVPLDWVGFDVADGWLVGFGMDLDGRLRELDWLGVVEE